MIRSAYLRARFFAPSILQGTATAMKRNVPDKR